MLDTCAGGSVWGRIAVLRRDPLGRQGCADSGRSSIEMRKSGGFGEADIREFVHMGGRSAAGSGQEERPRSVLKPIYRVRSIASLGIARRTESDSGERVEALHAI